MVNFKLSNETWKVNWSTWHKHETNKNLSPQQESNPWSRRECLSWIWFLSGTQIFFFVPRLWHVDQFTYHISLPSLKFTIFIHFIHIKYTRINSPYLSLKIPYKMAKIKNFITSIFGSRVLDWIVPHGCTTAQPTSRNVISCILRAFACWSIPWINPWVIYNQQSIDTSIDTVLLYVGVFNEVKLDTMPCLHVENVSTITWSCDLNEFMNN